MAADSVNLPDYPLLVLAKLGNFHVGFFVENHFGLPHRFLLSYFKVEVGRLLCGGGNQAKILLMAVGRMESGLL